MTPRAARARPAAALPRPGTEQLESYLAEVTARLPGPARAQAGAGPGEDRPACG
jgi:hypothetical protein